MLKIRIQDSALQEMRDEGMHAFLSKQDYCQVRKWFNTNGCGLVHKWFNTNGCGLVHQWFNTNGCGLVHKWFNTNGCGLVH